jgi:DnaJ-class molecular chaperone
MPLGRKDKTPADPCKKCGGTGEMEPSEKVRQLFGEHKFVCDRCGGTKTEPAPR